MELIDHLQGGNPIEVWIAGLIWSGMGIALVKVYYYRKEYNFNIKYWINDNIRDIGVGFLIAIVLLRMGDIAIKIIEQVSNYNLGEVNDFVAFMLFSSIYIQYKLHINRIPISTKVASKMVRSNRTRKQEQEQEQEQE